MSPEEHGQPGHQCGTLCGARSYRFTNHGHSKWDDEAVRWVPDYESWCAVCQVILNKRAETPG